jgi:hypothetical protein
MKFLAKDERRGFQRGKPNLCASGVFNRGNKRNELNQLNEPDYPAPNALS